MRKLTLVLPLFLVACQSEMNPVGTADDGGNAVAAWEDASGRRLESFDWGSNARNQVVDYVFVVDNSVSMNAVIDKVRAGFASLGEDDFPPESRIAVLSTLPADPADLTKLHRSVPPKVLRHDPGFGKLVSARSIRHARNNDKLRGSFPLDGCGDDGWFRPGDRNAQGQSCLVAHTQATLMASDAEAGLTAFKQLLERNAGELTFRPGAAVNVVFVSDTHDPGTTNRSAEDLLSNRPTPEDLAKLIERDNIVSSIRFHAIAPEVECVEPWQPFGPSYYAAAEYTGGAIIDMCTAEDYRPILQNVFDEGARPTKPAFALGAKAERVEAVTVDGIEVPWTLHPTGRVVQVDIPELSGNWRQKVASPGQTVEIHYQRDVPAVIESATTPTQPRFDARKRQMPRKQRTLQNPNR